MGIKFNNSEALFDATIAQRKVKFKINSDFTYEKFRERTQIFRALDQLVFANSFAISIASGMVDKAKSEFRGSKVEILNKALFDYLASGEEADIVLAGFARSEESGLYSPIVGVAYSNIDDTSKRFDDYVAKKIADKVYLMEALDRLK